MFPNPSHTLPVPRILLRGAQIIAHVCILENKLFPPTKLQRLLRLSEASNCRSQLYTTWSLTRCWLTSY
ncbi:hypothetical protein J1614_012163 [Plenodomus biglobosus]|nr:hypothetical protein J1614_012163 [Plenodomus biglobosus]